MLAKYVDGIALFLAVTVVSVAVSHKFRMHPEADPSPYFATIRGEAAKVTAAGAPAGWDVIEKPMEDSRRYLNANVCLNRTFRDRLTGVTVQMLLVQCPDIRDLVQHYPTICYPGRGLEEHVRQRVEWTTGGHEYHATFYQFESKDFQRGGVTQVYHFMLMPNGNVEADPVTLKRQMTLSDRHYGAAHVQFVFSDETVPEQERLKAVAALTELHRALFECILAGPAAR